MKTYFKEEQKFTQPWLWILLVVALSSMLIPTIVSLYVQMVLGKPYGDNPSSNETLLIMFFVVTIISVAVMVLFQRVRLITEIRSDGIFVRYPPFFFKAKVYTRNIIAEFEVRQYKPIKEFGGWGIKYGMGKHGKAYNVKGNQGLQLVFKNGRKLLIGTQRNDAILRAMNKMMKEEKNA